MIENRCDTEVAAKTGAPVQDAPTRHGALR